MKKNEQEILSEFGRKLITEVRDKTINQIEEVISNNGQGIYPEFYKTLISKFDDSQLKVFNTIISDIVDTSLHNFLWMIEEADKFKICAIDDYDYQELDSISDGLAGELYSDNGWIVKYSQKEKSLVDKILDKNT